MSLVELVDELNPVGVITEQPEDLHTELDLPEMAETYEDAEARLMSTKLLHVLRGLEGEMSANKAEYDVTMQYFKDQHGDRQEALQNRVDYVTKLIQGLFGFMKVPHKKKSLNLLGGKVGMRARQAELKVEDDKAVIEWALEGGPQGLVRTKHDIDRTGLRKLVQAGMISPPGVTLEERDDEFYAKPAE